MIIMCYQIDLNEDYDPVMKLDNCCFSSKNTYIMKFPLAIFLKIIQRAIISIGIKFLNGNLIVS